MFAKFNLPAQRYSQFECTYSIYIYIFIYLFIGVSTVLNILDNYINMCLLTPRYTDWKAPARRLDLYGWVTWPRTKSGWSGRHVNRQKKTTGISWLWYAVMIWQGYVKEVLNIFIINNHVDMTYKCVWVRIGWFFGLPHCIVSVNDRYCQVHHPKMNFFLGGKIWYQTFWWGLTTVVIQYK